MEQLGASLRREVVQEEGRFRQVYISFYTAKANQLAQRIRQDGVVALLPAMSVACSTSV